MPTLTILIIRHAEKPGESWRGPGLTPDGAVDDKSLVVRGWQRAGAWSALFGTGLNKADYPQPSKIYAADPAGTGGEDPSRRPWETIAPLADRLGLQVDKTYALGQEQQLVTTVLNQAGVMLIAWEHKAIVGKIVPKITNRRPLPGLPANWDRNRFDVVLRFDRASPGDSWSFRQLFPCLLSGDSTTPLE